MVRVIEKKERLISQSPGKRDERDIDHWGNTGTVLSASLRNWPAPHDARGSDDGRRTATSSRSTTIDLNENMWRRYISRYSHCSTLIMRSSSTSTSPSLSELNTLSFRERLRRVPLDHTLLHRLDDLRLGRTRDKRRKGDRQRQIDRKRRQGGDGDGRRWIGKPKRIVSCASEKEFPNARGTGTEIAFVGRSNVGKSSLLNAITGTSIVAKVSDKPGETQSVDFYRIGNGKAEYPTLVDLPGYGFAFSNEKAQEQWTRVMNAYLRSRSNLKTVCVLIDSRHGLKPIDLEFLDTLESAKRRSRIVMTKGDLVDRKTLAKMMWYTREQLRAFLYADSNVFPVSSRALAGLDELQRVIFPSSSSSKTP